MASIRRHDHFRLALAGCSGMMAMLSCATIPAVAQTTPSRVELVMPARPQAFVDTSYPSLSGQTIAVPGGGDLQAALDQAQPGETITLQAGATYRGPFTLPDKPGSGWIVIRTDTPDDKLPAQGTRVKQSDTRNMPKLVSSSGPVIQTAPRAHNFRFVGVEISPAPGTFLYEVVQLGADKGSAADMPHHLVFDRCYIHGDPQKGSRHGVVMNSSQTAVIDSYLSDFKEVGADAQAIVSWNGTGPFAITNNYLEASGEDVLFGGADPAIRGLVPSDIEIRGNLFSKQLSWKADDPAYAGKAWTVKNLLELKNARRVTIDGNVLQYNWPQAQDGFAILFTVRNQDGGAPWSAVEDITFTNNVVQHVGAAINILGHDDNHPSQQTRRILIRNNFFTDVGGSWGGGRLFQILSGAADVVIDHNTAFQSDVFILADGQPDTGFVFENNIVQNNLYGLAGAGTGVGTPSLDAFFPGAIFRGNVIVGGRAADYPDGNYFPASPQAVGFTDSQHNNYRLSASSHYHGAGTDGTDVGANFDTLYAALTTGGRPTAVPRVPTRRAVPRVPPVPDLAFVQAAIPFWPFVLLLGYTYLGYPLAIRILAASRRRNPVAGADRHSHGEGGQSARNTLPAVTVLVIAHDEAARIDAKIANLLQLEYPRDKLDIVIASDGSTDDTVARARAWEAAGVRTIAFDGRRGKPTVLDEVVPRLASPIVVLADTRQRFERDALRRLVTPFADVRIGAVSGELVLRRAATNGVTEGVGFYWRYEKFLREHESAVDSTLGTTGAIYAIRRELFEPIPPDTVLDDVVIPARIVRRGFRVIFEAGARAYDEPFETATAEFTRKVRTIAGTFQLFARERWLFNPRRNRIWFQAISHKGLRLLLPLMHLGAFAGNAALAASSTFYQGLFAGQIVFYGAAAAGAVRKRGARDEKRETSSEERSRFSLLVSVPYTMCLLNWATLVGFWRFCTGRQQATWQKASETVSAIARPSAWRP